MKIIETIMNIWIKISSLVVMSFAVFMIYLAFQFVGLYFDSQETFYKFLALGEYMPKTMSLSSTIISVFACLFSVVFGLAFYSPFLYYAWAKKPYIEDMKIYAKIISVILAVCLFLGMISAWGLEYTGRDFWFVNLLILFLIPLYYYAWRKEK